MLKTHTFVAIYTGNTIADAHIMAASCDPELITIAMQKMLPHANRSTRISLRKPRTRKRRGKENGREC